MTPEQQAAFIMAQAACLMAEIAGMQADNQHLAQAGLPPRYLSGDFHNVIARSGCGHNDVISFFRG